MPNGCRVRDLTHTVNYKRIIGYCIYKTLLLDKYDHIIYTLNFLLNCTKTIQIMSLQLNKVNSLIIHTFGQVLQRRMNHVHDH